jgi:hypothetical protein
MKNKTVVKKENKSGEFTTVHYSILRNLKLGPISKLLLIEILSDSNDFTFSQTLYCNRLGITKKTYFKAIKNLEECGYIRKTKVINRNLYHYTISEFGNLKTTEPGIVKIETTNTKEVKSVPTIAEQVNELKTAEDKYQENSEAETMAYDFIKVMAKPLCDEKIDIGTKEQKVIITNKVCDYFYKLVLNLNTSTEELTAEKIIERIITVKNSVVLMNKKVYSND